MADGTTNERWLDAFATPVAGGTSIQLHSGGKVAETGKTSLFGDDVEVRCPIGRSGAVPNELSRSCPTCYRSGFASLRPFQQQSGPSPPPSSTVTRKSIVHDHVASYFCPSCADCLHSFAQLLATIAGSGCILLAPLCGLSRAHPFTRHLLFDPILLSDQIREVRNLRLDSSGCSTTHALLPQWKQGQNGMMPPLPLGDFCARRRPFCFALSPLQNHSVRPTCRARVGGKPGRDLYPG